MVAAVRSGPFARQPVALPRAQLWHFHCLPGRPVVDTLASDWLMYTMGLFSKPMGTQQMTMGLVEQQHLCCTRAGEGRSLRLAATAPSTSAVGRLGCLPRKGLDLQVMRDLRGAQDPLAEPLPEAGGRSGSG